MAFGKSSRVLVLLLFVAGVHSDDLLSGCKDPPYNNGVAEIVVNALEAARPLMQSGVPSLGIPPLDPLGPLPSIVFSVENEALVLDGAVNETVVTNLAQFIICQLNVTLGLKQEIYFEFRLENFHMDGLYNLNGLAVSLFPIFGSGNYTLDTYTSGFAGYAKVTYNVLHDTISIKDLALDVFFEELELFLECILGCGDMADFVNGHLGDIGTAIFDAVWDQISPTLSSAVEHVVNEALQNVSVSEIIPLNRETELGNANSYLDLVLSVTSRKIVRAGLDPAVLPPMNIELSSLLKSNAVISNATLVGLSTIRRSGTATVDTVVDWIFLYSNIAIGQLIGIYPGAVYDGSDSDSFTVTFTIDIVDVYLTARGDTYDNILDIDQFVISELGPVDIDIEGFGVMGWLAETVSDALLNIFLDDVRNFLSNELKGALQEALNENPWVAP